MRTFKLKSIPATETLVYSSYYNADGLWNFVFYGTNTLSNTYSTTVAYFMRYFYSTEDADNCNSAFTDSSFVYTPTYTRVSMSVV